MLIAAAAAAAGAGAGAGCDSGDLSPGAVDGPATERYTCKPRETNAATAYSHVSAPAGPRAGTACLDAGCHDAGGSSRQFSFAGTVYKESAAIAPQAGVTVRIFKPGNDQPLAQAVTDSAGTFVIGMPGTLVDFPYDVQVTACGASVPIRPMSSAIIAADANCSTGGQCHGGGQGAIDFAD
jgi:hypothetical protein